MKHTLFLLAWLMSAMSANAQQTVRLGLQDAIAMATSPHGAAAVQLADATSDAERARVAYAKSLRYPVITATALASNVTRNLGAEGFNFPTGVPNFTIPQSVGPFAVYDARLAMTETLFSLSAIRQAREVKASYNAFKADADAHRETSAAQVAHDYLAALLADTTVTGARTDLQQAETMAHLAQGHIDAGQAADVELTQAQLRVSAGRRKLSSTQNTAALARLQLADDLGLDFETTIVLTDKLTFTPENVSDVTAEIAKALSQRPELQSAAQRELQAHEDIRAIKAEKLPTVSAFGDVGGLNSEETHTVGVSATITLFDGGRRKAQEAHSAAVAHQSEIQQRDLKRKIELEVRRAFANLQTAASQAQDCLAALTLSQTELAHVQRSYDGGIAVNADLSDAHLKVTQAQDDQTQAFFTWNQARVDLARATGTIDSLSMN